MMVEMMVLEMVDCLVALLVVETVDLKEQLVLMMVVMMVFDELVYSKVGRMVAKWAV